MIHLHDRIDALCHRDEDGFDFCRSRDRVAVERNNAKGMAGQRERNILSGTCIQKPE
jgi:hypothetical protein